MDIILFGMQGSGKGTQGKILEERYALKSFEMGAELRKAIASQNELGMKIKATVEAGNLVDDDTIMEVIEAFLSTIDSGQSLIFDGIPRTLVQSEKLLTLLEAHDRSVSGIFIDVDEEVAIERMLERGRNDDSMETIRRRLDNYIEQTTPVIKKFETEGRLIRVNGNLSIEAVTAEMLEKAAHLFETS